MGHFAFTFEQQLPTMDIEQEWDGYEGMPLLGEVAAEAHDTIAEIEAFQVLPERNQQVVLGMADFAMKRANLAQGTWGDISWRENFWGLYIVGSRARGDARDDSDLDLLSVGTFYREQGFLGLDKSDVFTDFELETPAKLPSEYNMGDVDRKYLVRATPTTEGVLPIDLNVVDLTFWRTTLDGFKTTLDIAQDGSELPRVPLLELTVPKDHFAVRL